MKHIFGLQKLPWYSLKKLIFFKVQIKRHLLIFHHFYFEQTNFKFLKFEITFYQFQVFLRQIGGISHEHFKKKNLSLLIEVIFVFCLNLISLPTILLVQVGSSSGSGKRNKTRKLKASVFSNWNWPQRHLYFSTQFKHPKCNFWREK